MKKMFLMLVFVGLVHAASALQPPFPEDFEIKGGIATGTINDQNGWVFAGECGDVQSGICYSGNQALELKSGVVNHELLSSCSTMWLSFHMYCMDPPKANPVIEEESTALAFFVGTNLNLVVYSNMVPVELSAHVQTNEWIRFDIYCDYENDYWNLSMNGTNVVAGLPLCSAEIPIDSLQIENQGTSAVYLDLISAAEQELQPSELPDTDSDGIPDWWEHKYSGEVCGISASSLSGNGRLTYLQTYVAALSPISYDPFVAGIAGGGNGLCWNPTPGRLFDVEWSPSLSSNFVVVATLSWPEKEYIDSAHDQEVAGFYRLRVRTK